MERAKPRLAPLGGSRGFTLNEILVSIALIAIGVLGFSLSTMGIIKGNSISDNVTAATFLAQDKLEEILASGNFANGSGSEPNISEIGTSGGRFTRTWDIQASEVGPQLKEIKVTVNWTGYLTTRQVVLATLVFTR